MDITIYFKYQYFQCTYVITTFTPQIKGIPEDTFGRYLNMYHFDTSDQTSVYITHCTGSGMLMKYMH